MSYQVTSFSNIIKVKFPSKKEPKKKKMAIPDYLTNYTASLDLVKRLLKFYHSRGFKAVKVWIETDILESGRRQYSIRSNIEFQTPA